MDFPHREVVKIDPHIHIDRHVSAGRQHGIGPVQLANTLVRSDLDAALLLTHRQPDVQAFVDTQDALSEALSRCVNGSRRDIQLVFGVELSVRFGGRSYHVVVAFEGQPNPLSAPAVPLQPIERLEVLEEFLQLPSREGIVAHAGVIGRQVADDVPKTVAFLKTGLFRGFEVANAHASYRGNPSQQRGFLHYGWSAISGARSHSLPISPIGASDAHEAFQVGAQSTEFYKNAGPAHGFFDALRRGKTTVSAEMATGARKQDLPISSW